MPSHNHRERIVSERLEKEAKLKRAKKIDELYYSPSERATAINSILFGHLEKLATEGLNDLPTKWDIALFCAEYLGMIAQGLGNDEFSHHSRGLLGILYSAHYDHPRDLYGEPDKKKGENKDA